MRNLPVRARYGQADDRLIRDAVLLRRQLGTQLSPSALLDILRQLQDIFDRLQRTFRSLPPQLRIDSMYTTSPAK